MNTPGQAIQLWGKNYCDDKACSTGIFMNSEVSKMDYGAILVQAKLVEIVPSLLPTKVSGPKQKYL